MCEAGGRSEVVGSVRFKNKYGDLRRHLLFADAVFFDAERVLLGILIKGYYREQNKDI